ncbi:NAD(P)-binding protein [Mytilinidion resinicola]|uniref:NAD(P)-binding protein n=1 Tax=Mytilinidion resinicola TaxID=574789 RepID=A0A6A6ZBS6_9PEZI|nr:NAD(P)-binding protein [Mytilinidion resinicola]KAF2817764.1 NAD(P)-binding protein [Mytilinidion resinicola]
MSELVFITGAAGYIGHKTLYFALEEGYKARCAIRKQEQAEKILARPSIAPFKDAIDFVVVTEMTKIGAFDDVLHGVTAIIHLASPLAKETDDYERNIVRPAIDINTSILSSAAKTPSIRRVIITSSAVTLVPFQWNLAPDSRRVYTERDVNTNPVQPYTSVMDAYWASKSLARTTVLDFISEQKPHFDVVSLLPSVVVGADERATSTEELLEGTRTLVMGPVLGVQSPFPMVGVPVDIVDVARAHVDAIKPSVPGNAEYVLSSDTPDGIEWDQALNLAKTYLPDDCGEGKALPLGGSFPTTKWLLDVSTTEKAFRWKFTPYATTMRGLMEQYVELANKAKA